MKKRTVQQLKKIADKYFSLAVRYRDSSDGMGECITCERPIEVKRAHAGHFMSRRHNATRYEPENVNLQCASCNTFHAGEQYKYSVALDKKYGGGTAKRLHDMAQQYHKFTTEELEQIIADSKEEVKFYEKQL